MVDILILGSGAREHAFAWKLAQSQHVRNIYVAPGNAGTQEQFLNVQLNPEEISEVQKWLEVNPVDMVLVGPEAPLVKGIIDSLEKLFPNTLFIGPSMYAAQLEGSKDFAKKFMVQHNIPTANYQTFSKNEKGEAIAFLEKMSAPYVIKADGLAGGKGVLISKTKEEAIRAIHQVLDGKFGAAGEKVVIEEFLEGIELSVFVLTDGKDYVLLPSAKDYKRIGENDTGLNTGGMGAVSPVSFADDKLMKEIEQSIIQPTIQGIQSEEMNYKGFIFFGLMCTAEGVKVIEYNCRMGDPETEVVMLRIESDLYELLHATATRTLAGQTCSFSSDFATTVFLVANGYPESYKKGETIHHLDTVEGSTLFHAGTIRDSSDTLTNGGRVLAISSQGETMKAALGKCYFNAQKISFEGKFYRRDIGFDLE